MCIEIDLEQDFKNILLSHYLSASNLKKRYDIELPSKQQRELENMNATDLLHSYLNFRKRLLCCGKQQIYISRELRKNPLYRKFRSQISKIKNIFINGSSIRPYLSNQINDFISPKSKDNLLMDWGLHHIHLFPTKKREGKSDNYLLFIMQKNDSVYFIDILTHQDFVNYNLLQIIYNNWKSALDNMKVSGIHPDVLTENEFKNLRKNGVAYTIGFEKDVDYAYATNLNSTNMSIAIDRIFLCLEELQQKILNAEKNIRQQLNIDADKTLSIHLDMQNNIFIIKEDYSNSRILFNNDKEIREFNELFNYTVKFI